jgi:hypothetical protein
MVLNLNFKFLSHGRFSPGNPCRPYENVGNVKQCSCHVDEIPQCCTCKPEEGWGDQKVCEWYKGKTDATDPKDWKGADFLPASYVNGAYCACSGFDEPSWKSPSLACVRKKLIPFHQEIPAAIKMAMKKATFRGDFINSTYVDMVYRMHDVAFKGCCCDGKIADKWAWQAIFLAGDLLPCRGITESIKLFGRCQCGW